MKTVLTHFYNEEYLLPIWLEHHKKIFDFGILIDYGSTDNSVEICKSICPDWQIFPSSNQYFDAELCDKEIEFYERQLPDYRIALTVTEFLMGDINKLSLNTIERVQWYIPCIRFTEWNPDGNLDLTKPLWEQLYTGIDYRKDITANQCRSYHNFNDIKYTTGRHYVPYNTEDCIIFHYAHCIVGDPMIKRRLQIQHKISPNDIERNLGNHHYVDKNGLDMQKLEVMQKSWLSVGSENLTEIIEKVTSKIS